MSEWIEKQDDPFSVFKQWFELAQEAGNFEPTAMTLATVDEKGAPNARVVLLKGWDEVGFQFFTNYTSVKGSDLAVHPQAALVFHWERPLHRQIRIRGAVEKLTADESNAYFQSRPRGSRIGAWASDQSTEISSRQVLKERVQKMEARFAEGEVPCPDHWGGYRVKPLSIEFWQEGEFRLHDRMHFARNNFNSPWLARRLSP